MKLRQLLVLGVVGVTSVFAGGNLLKNGDFELSRHPKDIRGYDWIQPAKQKFVTIDTAVKHSGKQSVRISEVGKTWVALIQCGYKIENFKKPLLIRGWCKYENLIAKFPDGKVAGMPFVGLWTRTKKGTNGPGLSIPNLFAAGSKDWFQFEYVFYPESVKKRFAHLHGDNAVAGFAFRINIASQTGTIWFDDLEMYELEPEAMTVKLPLADVSGKVLKAEITVAVPRADATVAVTISGKNEQIFKVPAPKNVIEIPVDKLAPGKYELKVVPKTGFPKEAKEVKVAFSKQADAFDEE